MIAVTALSQESLGTHTSPPRAWSDDYRGAMIFADAQRGEGQVQKVCCSASSRQTQAIRQISRVEMPHSRFQLSFAPVRNHYEH